MLRMSGFTFAQARDPQHAVELFAGADQAAWLAGGTDLLPAIKLKIQQPKLLIGLGQALPRSIEQQGGELVLGAGLRLMDLARQGPEPLAAAAASIAGPQIRAMGTLGGNVMLDTRCRFYNQSAHWREALGGCLKASGDICHVTGAPKSCVASQCADTIPALLVLGARLRLLSVEGTRELSLSEFLRYDGLRPHAVRPGELLTHVVLPQQGGVGASAKLRPRGSIDFPLISMSAWARLDGPEARIEELRVAIGATNPQPKVLPGLEAFVGQPLDEQRIQAVAEIAWMRTRPQGSLTGDVAWRRQVTRVFVSRLLRRLRSQHQEIE